MFAAVSFRQRNGGPYHGRVGEHVAELGQLVAFLVGPAAAGVALRRGFEPVCNEPQAGDETDVPAHRGERFDGGERGIRDDDDEAVGQPANEFRRSIWRMPWRAESVRVLCGRSFLSS